MYGAVKVPLPLRVAAVRLQLGFLYCIISIERAGSKSVAWSAIIHPNFAVTLLPPATSSLMVHCLLTALPASATGLSKVFFTLTEKLSAVPALVNTTGL